jgi:hypothetical protein
MDHPDRKPRYTAGLRQHARLHCFARTGAYVSATSQYTPIAPQFLFGKRTIFVLRRCTRPPAKYAGAMVVGRYAARFHLCLRQGAGRQFAWLQVDSVKATLSPLGRAPGMPSLRTACAIPPRRIELVEITSTPEGAYPLREDHPSGRYADASRWVSCGASIPNEANRKLRRIPCLARNLFTLPTSA